MRRTYYSDQNGFEYDDADLWAKAAEQQSFEKVYAEALLGRLSEEERRIIETMLDDYRRIQNADRAYPLIMTPDGFLADGYHRLVQALMSGAMVNVVRLHEMPAPRKEGEP